MTGTPLVSVIMPAYNAALTLGGAISGVLTQTYPAVELVVVDDGSTDDTAQIAESFGDRVRLVRQANGGTAKARNTAISKATGEYIALCDADDILLPSYLEKAMARLAEAGERSFVSSNARLLTKTGIGHGRSLMVGPFPSWERQRQEILEANFVAGFVVAPKAMFEELGGYSSELMVEDWDMWARAIFAGWRVVAQREPQALYRWTDASKSSRTEAVFDGENEVLESLLVNLADELTSDERAYLETRLREGSPRRFLHRADHCIREGRRKEAYENYRKAYRLLPSNNRVHVKMLLASTGPSSHVLHRILSRLDVAIGRAADEAR